MQIPPKTVTKCSHIKTRATIVFYIFLCPLAVVGIFFSLLVQGTEHNTQGKLNKNFLTESYVWLFLSEGFIDLVSSI